LLQAPAFAMAGAYQRLRTFAHDRRFH
jgi:hypothetical protein